MADVKPYCYALGPKGFACMLNVGHTGIHRAVRSQMPNDICYDEWQSDRFGNALPEPDAVNRPPHYTSSPVGIEAIDVTEHFNFNMGNAIKYIWRADLKGKPIEDLKKAAWYIQREIERRNKTK